MAQQSHPRNVLIPDRMASRRLSCTCTRLPTRCVQERALADAEALFAAADTDNDKRLSREEVCLMLKKVSWGWTAAPSHIAAEQRWKPVRCIRRLSVAGRQAC